MTEHWFRPKRFGLGAAPSTWQGWALTGGYIGAIVLAGAATGSPLESGAEKPFAFAVIATLLTAAFVYICWRKTEGGWRWRWGSD